MYKKCCAIKLCFSRELIQVLMSLYMSTKSINRQSCFGVLWNITSHKPTILQKYISGAAQSTDTRTSSSFLYSISSRPENQRVNGLIFRLGKYHSKG